MNNQDIINDIKNSFCNLTKFKIRENCLEVITAFSTLNFKFVSVFITFTNNKIVITDNGWIDQNYYETPLFEESENIIKRVIYSYKVSYKIKSTFDKDRIEFYYTTCENTNQIPNAVFNLANFIVGVVNSYCLQYEDEKEVKERENFKKNVNDFLKVHYHDRVKFSTNLDDLKTIKYSAIIKGKVDISLLNYVTGSNQTNFENGLRKSIVNFELAEKSNSRELIKNRIAIVNDESDGYKPDKSSFIFDLLREKTSMDPVKWSEKDKLLELIN